MANIDLNAFSPEKRKEIEGRVTFIRSEELLRRPVQGNFDAAHLREINRRIFQDLPEFNPGKYRDPAPGHSKQRKLASAGHTYLVAYANRNVLDERLDKVLQELDGGKSLQGLSINEFSVKMAKLYGDLDYLHPFKDGNSRSLRIFTAQLASTAGYRLDWNTTNVDAASRDELYMARDKEVMQREINDGVSKTAEKEIADTLMNLNYSDSLAVLIEKSITRTYHQDMAKSLVNDSKEVALAKFPKLESAMAVLDHIYKLSQDRGDEHSQRIEAQTRVKDIMAKEILAGKIPGMQIKKDKAPAPDAPVIAKPQSKSISR